MIIAITWLASLLLMVTGEPWKYTWNVNTPTVDTMNLADWTTNWRVTDLESGAEIPSAQIVAPTSNSDIVIDASSWASADVALRFLVDQVITVNNTALYGSVQNPFIFTFPSLNTSSSEPQAGSLIIHGHFKLFGNFTFRSEESPLDYPTRGAAITVLPTGRIIQGSMLRQMEAERASVVILLNAYLRSSLDSTTPPLVIESVSYYDTDKDCTTLPCSLDWIFRGFNYAPILHTLSTYTIFNMRIAEGATIETAGVVSPRGHWSIGSGGHLVNSSNEVTLDTRSLVTDGYATIMVSNLIIRALLYVGHDGYYRLFQVSNTITIGDGIATNNVTVPSITIWAAGDYDLKLVGASAAGWTLEGSWSNNVLITGTSPVTVVDQGFTVFNGNDFSKTITILNIPSLAIAARSTFGVTSGLYRLGNPAAMQIVCIKSSSCSIIVDDGSRLIGDINLINANINLIAATSYVNATTWTVDNTIIRIAHPHNINALQMIKVSDTPTSTGNYLYIDQVDTQQPFIARTNLFELVGGPSRSYEWNIATISNDRTVTLTQWLIGGNGQVRVGPATLAGIMTLSAMSEDADQPTLTINSGTTVRFIKGALETNVNTRVAIWGTLQADVRDGSSLFLRGKINEVKSQGGLISDTILGTAANLWLANSTSMAGYYTATSSDAPQPGIIIEGMVTIANGGKLNISGITVERAGGWFYLGQGDDGYASLAEDSSLMLSATKPTVVCSSDSNTVYLDRNAQLFVPLDIVKLPTCRFITHSPFTLASDHELDLTNAHLSTSSDIELGTSSSNAFTVAQGSSAIFTAKQVHIPGKLSGGAFIFGCSTPATFGDNSTIEVSYLRWQVLPHELTCTPPIVSFQHGVIADVIATTPVAINISAPGGIVSGRFWYRTDYDTSSTNTNGKLPEPSVFTINGPLLVPTFDGFKSSITISNFHVTIAAPISSDIRGILAFDQSTVKCRAPCTFMRWSGVELSELPRLLLENGTSFEVERDDYMIYDQLLDVTDGATFTVGAAVFSGAISSDSTITIAGVSTAATGTNKVTKFTGGNYLDNPYHWKPVITPFIIHALPTAGDIIVDLVKASDVTFNLEYDNIVKGHFTVRGTQLNRVNVNADRGRDNLPVTAELPYIYIGVEWTLTNIRLPTNGGMSIAPTADAVKQFTCALVWDRVNITLGTGAASEVDVRFNTSISVITAAYITMNAPRNPTATKVVIREGASLTVESSARFTTDVSLQVWGRMNVRARAIVKIGATLRIDGGTQVQPAATLLFEGISSVAIDTLIIPAGSVVAFSFTGAEAAAVTIATSLRIDGKIQVILKEGAKLADGDYTLFTVTSKDIVVPAASQVVVPAGAVILVVSNQVVLRIGGGTDPDSSSGPSGGVIAGIIIASLVVIAAVAGLCVCMKRRRRKTDSDDLFERLAM